MIAMTPGDVILTLIVNGTAVGTVNMPYSVAKTLAEDITKTVMEFETITQQSVKDIKSVARDLHNAKGGDRGRA